MKARVKATGEIVTIAGTDGICLVDENGNYHLIRDLEGCEAMPDYWEKLKHRYAGMAMQGMLSDKEMFNTIIHGVYPPERPTYLAARCDEYATALVNRLKEEEK